MGVDLYTGRSEMTSAPTSCIRWFNDLRLTDLPLVGGKALRVRPNGLNL